MLTAQEHSYHSHKRCCLIFMNRYLNMNAEFEGEKQDFGAGSIFCFHLQPSVFQAVLTPSCFGRLSSVHVESNRGETRWSKCIFGTSLVSSDNDRASCQLFYSPADICSRSVKEQTDAQRKFWRRYLLFGDCMCLSYPESPEY